MIKWKLMLTTLPVAAAVLLAKLLVERWSGNAGFVDFSDVAPLLTAGAFLIGFMLAGTMSDYKESEKMPADIACALETIEDTMVACSHRKELVIGDMRAKLFVVTSAILDWLGKQRPVTDVYAALSALQPIFMEMDKAGGATLANRVVGEAHAVRKAVTRVDVIARTSFLASGYALLDVMVAAIIGLLLVSRFKSPVAQYTMTGLITLVYVYMLRLIRDIDDPFEYAADLKKRGAAEVDMFPLLEYRDRAKTRLG